MTQAEYEARLRALEQQLQADMALLQAAHEVRVRSLERLRQAAQDGESPASRPAAPVRAQAPAAVAPPPKRQPARRGAVLEDVEAILPQLPEEFDRRDVDRLLGYSPTRTTLFRALDSLERDGLIEVAEHSYGRQLVQYRKCKQPQ